MCWPNQISQYCQTLFKITNITKPETNSQIMKLHMIFNCKYLFGLQYVLSIQKNLLFFVFFNFDVLFQVDANDVWKIPSKVKFSCGAVVLHAHSNALYAFSRLIKVKKEDKIIVSTGPAGLGLAAVDVLSNIFKVKVMQKFSNIQI